jgi:hypothetical protein
MTSPRFVGSGTRSLDHAGDVHVCREELRMGSGCVSPSGESGVGTMTESHVLSLFSIN